MKVLIPFLLVAFLCPLMTIHAQDNATYIGVWRAGKKTQKLYPATDNLFEIEKKAKAQGYAQLADLELLTTEFPYSESSWSVWEKPTNFTSTWTVGSWANIIKDFQNFQKGSGRNRRYISNIESYYSVSNKVIYFHGIFKSGTRKQHLIRSFSWEGFVKNWESLSRNNMRLQQVETLNRRGKIYFFSIFSEGTGGHYLYNLVGWNNFVKKWQELGKKNYRLVDIESYVQNGRRHYIGVWHYGKDGYVLYNVKGFNNFKKKMDEFGRQGLELIDLEVIR